MKQTYKIGNKVVTKKQFEASNKHLVNLDSVANALPEHTEGQTSEARHTPTPWTAEIINNWPDSQEKANQEFMLRAVNSYDEFKRKADAHEELVAALRVMVDHAKETYPHFESARGQADIKAAESALAEAGVLS